MFDNKQITTPEKLEWNYTFVSAEDNIPGLGRCEYASLWTGLLRLTASWDEMSQAYRYEVMDGGENRTLAFGLSHSSQGLSGCQQSALAAAATVLLGQNYKLMELSGSFNVGYVSGARREGRWNNEL